MPIYEYRCSKCGEFEAMQSISDKPLRQCPTCRGRVTKLISSTSFQLKGSGWYVTDYARKGSGTPKSDGKKTGEAASEAKPDTGSATKGTAAKEATT